MIGRPFKSPCGPIGQCCQSVAQQFAFLVHTGNYNPVCAEIKSACRAHPLGRQRTAEGHN
jgi:hypothetical protein